MNVYYFIFISRIGSVRMLPRWEVTHYTHTNNQKNRPKEFNKEIITIIIQTKG